MKTRWNGVDIAEGELWKATENPYPKKGHPHMGIAWEIGVTYLVYEINLMGGKYTPQVSFKLPDDTRPMGGWEVGADTFVLGFERESRQ